MDTNKITPRQKLAAAMLRVCGSSSGADGKGWAPYFSAALRGLIRREMDETMAAAIVAVHGSEPTMAVSANGILYWYPAFVEEKSTDYLAFVLMHEVMHLLLKHGDRSKALGVPPDKLRLSNLAQDACINEQLRKSHPNVAPTDCCYPESPEIQQEPNLTFEVRNQLLLQRQAQSQSSGTAGNGLCGGCANHPVPGEAQAGTGGGHDEKEGSAPKSDGRSQAELDRMRRETAQAVKDYTSQNKNRGTVPESLERWADEMLSPPKIDWRTKLAQSMRSAIAYRAGMVDFSWTRASRRQAGMGFGVGRPVMPSYRAPVPSVACGIDTSGSMAQTDLADAAAEVQGILAATGVPVTVVACDAAVHGVKECATIGEAVGMLKGGGGTSMTPIFEELETRKVRPELVVILTDGHIGNGHPSVEPSWCSTIWVVVGASGNPTPCPWGEVILAFDEKAAA